MYSGKWRAEEAHTRPVKTDHCSRQPGTVFGVENGQRFSKKNPLESLSIDVYDPNFFQAERPVALVFDERGKVLILFSARGDFSQPSPFWSRQRSVRFVRNEQFFWTSFFPSLPAFNFPFFFSIFSFLFVQFLQPLFLLIICPFGHKISRLRNGGDALKRWTPL